MYQNFSSISIWIFFNVILALFPLIVNFILIFLIPREKIQNWHWTEFLGEGELFFFSTTLAAIGIGDILLENKEIESIKIGLTLILIALAFVLLLSCIIFGCSTYIKIQKEIQEESNNILEFDKIKMAYGSIGCAIMVIILSLAAFLSKGG